MIKKPRGTEDWFGENQKELTALKNLIRNFMNVYNYDEIKTPTFESYDLFSRSVGDESDIVSKEMFEFTDKKGRKFALRPEGTAPTVRLLIENKLYIDENMPLKLFYISPMFRYERPQQGRNREFNQFGVELYGSDYYFSDIEVITLAESILSSLELKNTKLLINFLVSGEERKKYLEKLKTFLIKKELCDDCKNRIEKNTLRVLDCKIDGKKFNDVPDMTDFLNKNDKEKFETILETLKLMEVNYVIDKKLVRGLDYYTGIVFEFISEDQNQGTQATLIAGGRYNNLVKELGGPNLPAVGFGMGLERMLICLENQKIKLNENKSIDAFIIGLTEKGIQVGMIVSKILRTIGISCEINHLNKPLKNAFKIIDRLNCKNVMIIGEKEIKGNYVIVRNQITKEEVKVNFNQITDFFKKGE